MFVSLDGVMEDPSWTFRVSDEARDRFKFDELAAAGAPEGYRLMIFPVVVGKGKRLFRDGLGTKAMELVDTTTFDPGTIVLTYRPAEREAE